LCGCAPAASSTPLANAAPEGPEVYFYGDASRGGKDLGEQAGAGAKSEAVSATRSQGDSKTASGKTDKLTSATHAQASDGDTPSGSAHETASLPAASFEDLPGQYAGNDRLAIDIDGAPERVETDDAAKLTVEKSGDGKPDEYVFSIVDSQSGNDLCSVTGVAKKQAIEFEPGQSCLDTILGLPMEAKLASGSAKLDGKDLVVDYAIDLEIDSPRGTLDGKINYHFAGTRE
jgi:hypothetical protein